MSLDYTDNGVYERLQSVLVKCDSKNNTPCESRVTNTNDLRELRHVLYVVQVMSRSTPCYSAICCESHVT